MWTDVCGPVAKRIWDAWPGYGKRTAREFNIALYEEMVRAHLRSNRYCTCGEFRTWESVFAFCRAHDAYALPTRHWDGEPLLDT